MKYILIFVGIIFVFFIILRFGTFYQTNCSGDICGGVETLQHSFGKGEAFCKLAGGNYEVDTALVKQTSCQVKSKTLCKIRGGRFIDSSQLNGEDSMFFVLPQGTYCFKNK